jgi:hypothetical protein
LTHTANEHLLIGRRAVEEIQSAPVCGEVAVCFHFLPPNDADASKLGYGIEAVYWPTLEQRFALLDIDGWIDGSGGEFGFEIWENVTPSPAWLEQRVPQMLALAADLEHEFEGWTFEPRSGQVVSAAPNTRVWDVGTAEGRQSFRELLADIQHSRGSKKGE